jgi:hypothetical protein
VLDLWREEEFSMLEKELMGNPVTLLEKELALSLKVKDA